MGNKEYNYYMFLCGMDTCKCGHKALTHSWWVGSSVEDPPELEACDWIGCKCMKYERDNLIYLEDLAQRR